MLGLFASKMHVRTRRVGEPLGVTSCHFAFEQVNQSSEWLAGTPGPTKQWRRTSVPAIFLYESELVSRCD